jgi:hypothetical protein
VRPTLPISAVPRPTSRVWICWLTAEGVTPSSSAARVMLPARATAWKTVMARRGTGMATL